MTRFWQDLRFAVRLLVRSPLFTTVAVLTLAVGTGANTAVFAGVYAALLRPLPFPDAGRLIVASPLAPGVFLDWQRQAKAFQGMAAYRVGAVAVSSSGSPERVNGAVVSVQFFDVLGVSPLIGRSFVPADAAGGGRPVILSHAYWNQRYGADRRVIGQTVILDGEPVTVVGVMPPGVDFPFEIDLWTLAPHGVPAHPLRPHEDPTNVRSTLYLGVCARLAVGVSLAQARDEQRGIFERLRTEYPTEILAEDVDLAVVPIREWLLADLRSPLLLLGLAAGLVFLTACANVASLLLGRSAARRREIAIRAALGASATRIVRQVLTETAVLAAIAGAVGVCLAAWLLPVLLTLVPDDLRDVHPVASPPVLLFGLALSVVSGLVFGGAPALTTARQAPVSALGSSRSPDAPIGCRSRSALVALEFALSLALLVTAALLMRSFVHLREVEPGFQAAGLLTVSVELPPGSYATPQRQRLFFDALLERVRGLPAIEGVAAAGRLPFGGVDSTRGLVIEGTAPSQAWGGIRVVSADYFQIMGIPLRRGRGLHDADRSGSPRVAIINEAMARRYWPGTNPIGHRFRLGDGGPSIDIVGEVADSKFASLREAAEPEFFISYRQEPWSALSLVIRSRLNTGLTSRAVEQIVHDLDPNLALPSARPLSAFLAGATETERLETVGMSAFAILTLLLASVGLFGVTAYLVGQRTREVAIRMALGATRGAIVRDVIREAMRPLAPGLIAGSCLAFIGVQILRHQLFEIHAATPFAAAGLAAAILTAVASIASAIPAWRAAGVDPIDALRND